MAYTKYSLTPADNNAAPPNGAPEGMLPSAVNDTMRDMMSQIRDVGDGIRDGTYTMTAPKITGGSITGVTYSNIVITGGSITGAALSGNTFTNPVITGGSINNTTIGATTASTGAFTTLGATGVATFSAGAVSAPAITTTGDTNTGIFFPAADTIAFSEGGTESARFDSSGNLGIGTTSPTSKLDVSGEIKTLNDTASTGVIIKRTGGVNANGAVNFVGSDDAVDASVRMATDVANALVFTAGGATERMRIDSSGNLLVNTTSQLNNAKISGFNSNNVFAAVCSIGASGYYNLSQNNNGFVFYAESGTNTFRGSVSYNGTGLSYNSASDYRLKNVVGPIQNALETVMLLKPCKFTWKENNELDTGFIAHELQEHFPKAVSGEKDAVDADGNPIYQGIDTSFLVATLTAAIQEQQAMITSLTARITALEGTAV
jgi:hypothetical protein